MTDPAVESAPESGQFKGPLICLDLQGWLQSIGGFVVALIAVFTSYDHLNLPGPSSPSSSHSFPINQQWGFWLILASVAVVFVDAQLATRSRLRAANTAAEERERAANRETAQLRRARVEAEAQRAQLAYLLEPSAAHREQLEQVLSKLNSPEVRALFDDE
ncbi:hypothetical protein [Cyanobium sp. WAJ14-Wanaka]|uniref:hypothetical protein n=1 Tax=Cyanobium sp. WAJ14-Wanaka TaxID=2823725 RepID=UPI0020CCE05E|nr:hypothetical protein [Cyanobium sp. WAJ14-Wanaka]MCP9775655.1 hypothetical protein [Cyanobium sp. WAJ14-Wanaka]